MIEIYADGLVLINFIIDYVLLCSLVKIIGRNKNGKRIFISSLFGGLSSLLIFLPPNLLLLQFLLKIVSVMLMILIANRFVSIKQYVKEIFSFLFLNCVFGGFVFLLYVLFPRKNAFVNPLAVYFHISPLFLLFSLAITYVCIFAFKAFTEKALLKSGNYKVTVSLFGKKKEFDGFLDTGNLLKDPLSGVPVIVASLSGASPLLSAQVKAIFENEDFEIDKAINLTNEFKKSFRLIPYNTIDKSGLLPSIKTDFIEIQSDKSFSIIPSAYLAITKESLGDSENKIILNPALLKLSQNKNYI